MSTDAYSQIVSRFGELTTEEQEQLVRELTTSMAKGNGTGQFQDVGKRFKALVAAWRATRGHHSRIDRLVMNDAYQAIIGLGPAAVPLLLREMEERPDHWDWALRAITETDPVTKECWGDLKAIASAWVRWGRINGYQW